MILKQHFSLPIWEDIIDVHYRPYADRCLEFEKNYPNRHLSNVGGWQSKSRDEHIDEFMLETYQKIHGVVNSIYSHMAVSGDCSLLNYWFNVNKKYNYNYMHMYFLN